MNTAQFFTYVGRHWAHERLLRLWKSCFCNFHNRISSSQHNATTKSSQILANHPSGRLVARACARNKSLNMGLTIMRVPCVAEKTKKLIAKEEIHFKKICTYVLFTVLAQRRRCTARILKWLPSEPNHTDVGLNNIRKFWLWISTRIHETTCRSFSVSEASTKHVTRNTRDGRGYT